MRPLPALPCLALAACLACVCAWVGCAPSTPATKPPANQGVKATGDNHGHDHGDQDHDEHHDDHGHEVHAHPATLAEGLKELESVVTAVKTHLDAGARAKADKAVHLVGHLVEDLRGLLPKEKLSVEAQAAAGKALDEIFDGFDAIDSALHAAEGKGKPPAEVHAAVAEKIAAAITTLKGLKEAP